MPRSYARETLATRCRTYALALLACGASPVSSSRMDFVKLHGTGNDFIVIDARGLDRDWSDAARRMCDRHFGAGADGLILLAGSVGGPSLSPDQVPRWQRPPHSSV